MSTIPELKPFLKARGEKTEGKKADLAKAAYESREKVVALQPAPDVVMTEVEEPPQPALITVPVTTHSECSIFTADREFIDMVQKTFDPKELHLRQDMDIAILNQEQDALCQNMRYRLVCHIHKKFRRRNATIGCSSLSEKTFVMRCLP
jgi:hypothetical protein